MVAVVDAGVVGGSQAVKAVVGIAVLPVSRNRIACCRLVPYDGADVAVKARRAAVCRVLITYLLAEDIACDVSGPSAQVVSVIDAHRPVAKYV